MSQLFKRPEDKKLSQQIKRLSYCNPFSKERTEIEKEILGKDFYQPDEAWNIEMLQEGEIENVSKILSRLRPVLDYLRDQLESGAIKNIRGQEAEDYEALVLFFVYHEFRDYFRTWIRQRESGQHIEDRRPPFYKDFKAKLEHYLYAGDIEYPLNVESAHLFAAVFQLYRAFYYIYNFIFGTSRSMIRLRERIWESIFTKEMHFFRRALYNRMTEISTLIIGPSGSGKELIARAVGLTRYIPFDEKSGQFKADFTKSFYPLNISALTPNLVESELFGHKKGAFTGAIADRQGWLEASGEHGNVFLDEIGELDKSIQVKLLRVLQTREFQRIGDNKNRVFQGKIIAATNRDLSQEIEAGRFRSDFYYRICSDIVEVPSLSQRIQEDVTELESLLLKLSQKLIGREHSEEVAQFVESSKDWILTKLGRAYPWPGNVRELEQCVRNLLIHGNYRPYQESISEPKDLAQMLLGSGFDAESLVNYYSKVLYQKTGNYEETGRLLGLDRRTVKRRVLEAEA